MEIYSIFARSKENFSQIHPPGKALKNIFLLRKTERFQQKEENMKLTEQLDKTDIDILGALQKNARLTVKELASIVHLSTTPVFERLKRLEREGYIKKYVAILDAEKLGRGFVVFCSVKLRQMGKDIALDFVEKIRTVPEVTECYNISGEYDYLLKIHAKDMKSYQSFLINVLGTISSLGSIQSSFVMSSIKEDSAFPLTTDNSL